MIRRQFLTRVLGADAASLFGRVASAQHPADHAGIAGMEGMDDMPGMASPAHHTKPSTVALAAPDAPLAALRTLGNESREPGHFRATLTAQPIARPLLPGVAPTTFWQYGTLARGPVVGPMIDVREGDTVEIHFENQLPFLCGAAGLVDERLYRDKLLPILDSGPRLFDRRPIVGVPDEIGDAASRLIQQRVGQLQQRNVQEEDQFDRARRRLEFTNLGGTPGLYAQRIGALFLDRYRIQVPRVCAERLQEADLRQSFGNGGRAVPCRRRLESFEHGHP